MLNTRANLVKYLVGMILMQVRRRCEPKVALQAEEKQIAHLFEASTIGVYS
jgi:hypothetical protein